MQAGAEVVAAEIFLFEVKLGERMGAIDDGFDSFRARHFADSFHGRDLARDVYLVRHQDQFRSVCDSTLEGSRDLVEVLWWDRNLHHLQDQSLAAFALAQRGQHARVVLSGAEDFIARFEIHAHEQDLERLRSVASDGDLFAVAAKDLGQAGANCFRLRLEYLPHRVGGCVFLLPDVTDERFGDDAWTRRDAAVVQVDYAACNGEGVLNDRPVVFIHRDLFGREVRDASAGRFELFKQHADSRHR